MFMSVLLLWLTVRLSQKQANVHCNNVPSRCHTSIIYTKWLLQCYCMWSAKLIIMHQGLRIPLPTSVWMKHMVVTKVNFMYKARSACLAHTIVPLISIPVCLTTASGRIFTGTGAIGNAGNFRLRLGRNWTPPVGGKERKQLCLSFWKSLKTAWMSMKRAGQKCPLQVLWDQCHLCVWMNGGPR